MIRVAQVMGKMNGGGVEQVVMNYYRHIDRDKIQFDFLVDCDSKLVPRKEIESLGGRVFEVPPYQRIVSYRKELRKLFQENRWLVVHSHINALSVFPLGIAKAEGVPVRIAHSHSTAGKGESLKTALKYVLKTTSNIYPTHRFACSKYAGQWLFGNKVQFDVVNNAISLDDFCFDEKVRLIERRKLGAIDSTFVVGHVGRFAIQKNHKFLLKVFADIQKFKPDSLLVLVGDGELEDEIRLLAEELNLVDKVIFLGQRNDIADLYQAFDVFVLPSLYEGFGMVAVEAQASGLPCFISDAVTREVDVTNTCEFLPLDNSIVWAEAICGIQPERRLRKINYADFCNYDINIASNLMLKRYERIVGECFRE